MTTIAMGLVLLTYGGVRAEEPCGLNNISIGLSLDRLTENRRITDQCTITVSPLASTGLLNTQAKADMVNFIKKYPSRQYTYKVKFLEGNTTQGKYNYLLEVYATGSDTKSDKFSFWVTKD